MFIFAAFDCKTNMIRISFTIAVLCLNFMGLTEDKTSSGNHKDISLGNGVFGLYSEVFQLGPKPSFEAFQVAYEGFVFLTDNKIVDNPHFLSIVDFSMASSQKRYWLVDLEKKQVLFNTFIAHGKNTGIEKAERFSNRKNSNMSSLGFYLTKETYLGKHGYSLRLDGLEKGINSNARDRAIVIHQADYVSQEYIENNGRLGRSFGCPALPMEYNQAIIDLIKGKSVFFIYYPSENYFKNSEILDALNS